MFVCFFKQKTAYEMRISDWSSDVCSSDLNRYVDHVQITAAEAVTVGTRGRFYDATGALRVMVPNHLFQLLAMIAMEPPISFDADAIRTEKEKVIAALLPVQPAQAIRGRYCSGSSAGKAGPRSLDPPDVDHGTPTEPAPP